MRYRDAVNLHNEDEVIVKSTGCGMIVIETEIVSREKSADGKPAVMIMLEDGNMYHHTEVA